VAARISHRSKIVASQNRAARQLRHRGKTRVSSSHLALLFRSMTRHACAKWSSLNTRGLTQADHKLMTSFRKSRCGLQLPRFFRQCHSPIGVTWFALPGMNPARCTSAASNAGKVLVALACASPMGRMLCSFHSMICTGHRHSCSPQALAVGRIGRSRPVMTQTQLTCCITLWRLASWPVAPPKGVFRAFLAY
jgi:hypothetical protein